MSEVNQRKELKIPPSHDVGVHFYYRNLLGGSDYVQAYIREYIAIFDEPHAKLFETVNAGGAIDSSERRQMPYEALLAVLDDAGVGEKILGQIKEHISHMAGGIGKPLDYLRVREFLSFCGIEGIFDLETKKHNKQERKVRRIPPTIVPERWRSAPDVEDIRQDIAFMMDKTNRIPEFDAKIRALNMTVWGEFVVEVTKDVQNTPVPTDLEPLRQAYLKERPHLVSLNDELVGLVASRESAIAEMKNQYAPMDADFKLPALGIEFDKSWFDKGEALINKQKPYRQKFDKYMAGLGHKKGDPEYDSFDWQNIRSRSFAIWDWAYRDYTASPVNRGVLADARMGDFDKGFVKAVKDELQDGLLGILDLPYKIEAVEGQKDQYVIVCNDCVTEAFTLQQVYDLETKVIEEAEKTARNPKANSRRKSSPAPVASVAPATTPKPVKSAEQKANEKLEREKRIRDALIATGVDEADITAHNAQGVKSKAGVDSVVSPAPTVAMDESNEVTMTTNPAQPAQDASPELIEPSGVATVAEQPTSNVNAESGPTARPVVEDEEELLFPGAGVSGEGGLDDNGNKIKETAEKTEAPVSDNNEAHTDDAVVNFGNVAPDRGATAPEGPTKKAEQPATPKESTSKEKSSLEPSRANEKTESKDDGKKTSPNHDSSREAKKPNGEHPFKPWAERQLGAGRGSQRDDDKPNPRYEGGGGGGSGNGYSNYNNTGHRPFNPQSMTVDLGLGHIVRSLTGLGRSVRASLRPVGPNVFQATEALNAAVDQVSSTRTSLASGVDEAGAPLTEAVKITKWTQLKGDLEALDGQVKTLKKVPSGAMDEDTLKSFKNAAKEMNATKDLAKKESQSPGKLGELATEAQKLAEKLSEVMMNIVRAIMKVFDRNKSPSP